MWTVHLNNVISAKQMFYLLLGFGGKKIWPCQV